MTLPTPRETMLAKVRKLLAKAEDPAATVEEAETYTAKAAALVATYGIDAALLAAEDPATDPIEDRRIPLDAPYAADKADLLGTVALRMRCQVVRLRSRGPEGTRWTVHVFGHRSDLERAEVLFTSLLLQAGTRMLTTPVPPWDHTAAFRRSWLAGFTAAVSRRLALAEHAARVESDADRGESRTTTLVLADRDHLVRSAAEQAHPDARTMRERRLTGSGGRDGYAAGQRADLGGTRLHGARHQLPPVRLTPSHPTPPPVVEEECARMDAGLQGAAGATAVSKPGEASADRSTRSRATQRPHPGRAVAREADTGVIRRSLRSLLDLRGR